jgi:hypothetical protein
MGTVDPERVAGTELSEGHPGYAVTKEAPGPSDRPPRLRRIVLIAGLAAGLLAWLLGEAAYGTFAPPPELTSTVNFSLSPILAREKSAANIKNATLTFGLLGAVLGVALGAAGGAARRSTRAGVVAGTVGLVLGGAVGAQTAWVLMPIAERNQVLVSESMFFVLMIHGGIWSAIGAAGGLAFGLGIGGRGRILRAMLGGLVGASLGTVVYDLLGAVAFPAAETGSSLSITWGTRLLAHLCVTVAAALGVALALDAQAPRPGSSRPVRPPDLLRTSQAPT